MSFHFAWAAFCFHLNNLTWRFKELRKKRDTTWKQLATEKYFHVLRHKANWGVRFENARFYVEISMHESLFGVIRVWETKHQTCYCFQMFVKCWWWNMNSLNLIFRFSGFMWIHCLFRAFNSTSKVDKVPSMNIALQAIITYLTLLHETCLYDGIERKTKHFQWKVFLAFLVMFNDGCASV